MFSRGYLVYVNVVKAKPKCKVAHALPAVHAPSYFAHVEQRPLVVWKVFIGFNKGLTVFRSSFKCY